MKRRWLLILTLILPSLAGAISFAATDARSKPVSTNVALYTYLRAVAADDLDEPEDRARSAAMIKQIGLDPADTKTFSTVVVEYASSIHKLHDPTSTNGSASDLQRGEIGAYAHVIQRLRSELSPDGLQILRDHLEAKKSKMKLHTREEAGK